MNDRRLKSLDEFSDESEQFEERFLKLKEIKDNGSAARQLIVDIAAWLEECARHGRYIPPASADRRALRSIIERWKSRLRVHGALIEDIVSLADFDPIAGVVLETDCPYPGLEPYEENRCGSFFGQDALVSDCIKHFEKKGNRTFLLLGASGSGKSSVALAGILPQLKKNNQDTWLFCQPLTPGANPLSALAISVADVIDHSDQTTEIEETLSVKPDKAFDVLANLCGDKPLMLLIDQFEELFTQCHDERMQSSFAKVLCALSEPAACGRNFSCKILLTLRTDQLARFENSKALKPLRDRLMDDKNKHFHYLSTIGFDHIKQAVKKPANEVGLRFIPASLIDQLASQTAGLTNGLPLLQFSLQQLWKNRPRNEFGESLDLVTEAMVNSLPDVEHALGQVADNIFKNFTAEQKKICERLLLELMVLDESFDEPMRRRRNESELKEVLATLPGNSDDIARVIAAFVDEGLLRRFGDDSESQIEVAHEALLRRWKHIYNLLMEGEVKQRLFLIKKIKADALEWKGHPDNSSDYLNLKGEPLKRAREYAAEKWLEEEESAAYVAACTLQEEQIEEAEHQAKEAKRQALKAKEKAERQRLVSIFLAILISFAALGGGIVYKAKKDAKIKKVKARIERKNAAVATRISDLVSRGHYYLQLDNHKLDVFAKAAKKSFSEADELAEGESKAAKLGLGLIYLREEDYQRAIDQFKDLIDFAEDKERENKEEYFVVPTYYLYRGQALQGNNNHSDAILDFKRAIEMKEERDPLNESLADYYFHLGLSHYALSHHALKDMSNTQNIYAQMAFSKAIKLLEESNLKDENLAKYYYNLGRSYEDAQDMDKAEELYEKAISFPRKIDVPAYYALGTLYLKRGDKAKDKGDVVGAQDKFRRAQKQFEQAIRLAGKENDDMLNFNIRLGNALSAQKNKQEEAIRAYYEAADINPNSAWVELYLADAYISNKDWENAMLHLKRAEQLAVSDNQLQAEEEMDFFNDKVEEVKNNSQEISNK